MESLNLVNLIQSGTVTVGALGLFLLWRTREFRGIALLLCLIAFASLINILEETGLTREWHLISPVFIMLFGPATFLAAKFAITNHLTKRDFWHLFPVLPLVFFTSYIHIVIALGTVWRLIYTYLTAVILFKYKKQMDQQRSDSDEYSLNWLVWLLVVTAMFNLIDLIRLNMQPMLSYEINVFGQGINNFVWLIASMIIIYQFSRLDGLPKNGDTSIETNDNEQHVKSEYQAIFDELDRLIVKHHWYLTPRLTLANMSELTGMQTRDISRAINLHASKSFNDYINQFRVQAFCDKLKANSEESLTNLAFDAGFSSKASFNKVFKQILGITPSEYKTRLRSCSSDN